MKLNLDIKQKVAIGAFLSIVVLPFTAIGAANAYSAFTRMALENTLQASTNSVEAQLKASDAVQHALEAARATQCEAYQALKSYKQENKIAIDGATSPCFQEGTSQPVKLESKPL